MASSIQITDSIGTIEKNVNAAIASLMNDVIRRQLPIIVTRIENLFPNWISSQPEIQSILSQSSMSLAGQFGLTGNAQSIVNNIINSVINSTEINFVPYTPNLRGGLELNFQPATFSNLLSLPDGHTVYESADLHWLEWLLKRGDEIIVANYQYDPQTGVGRSGLGSMVPGGAFRVPPEFSGTENNNFITRALVGPNQEKQITDIIQDILQ